MQSPNRRSSCRNVKAYWLTDFKKQEDGIAEARPSTK